VKELPTVPSDGNASDAEIPTTAQTSSVKLMTTLAVAGALAALEQAPEALVVWVLGGIICRGKTVIKLANGCLDAEIPVTTGVTRVVKNKITSQRFTLRVWAADSWGPFPARSLARHFTRLTEPFTRSTVTLA